MRFPQSRFVRLVGMGALFAGTMPSPAAAQTHARSLDDAAAAPLIGFGAAVAVSGGEIFVSRPGEFVGFPMPGSEAGSVHVFRRDEDGWAEVATIEAPSGVYGDGFGTVLAVRNDFLVVGAPKENDRRGAAYVFVREGGAWHLLERLEAPDAVPGDDFGSSITMETGYGRSISWLLGAPGRGTTGSVFRYLYYSADQVVRRGGFDTTGRDELTGSSAPDGARFGAAVSLDGDMVLVGAPGPFSLDRYDPSPTFQAGTGYVFHRSEDGLTAGIRLTPGEDGGAAGLSALLVNGEALLGAPGADQGRGMVFRFEAGPDWAWPQIGRIRGPAPGALFGYSLARAGELLVVGAPRADGSRGAAYVYAMGEDGAWREETVLRARTRGLMGFMGSALAAEDGILAVGAPGSEFFEGIGFVFERDEDGGWTEATPFHETGSGLQAVTGEERRCSDQGTVAGFSCADVDLVSFLPANEAGGSRGIMVSDIWGWVDPRTGREYAILGRFDGTSFIDVTDAGNPVYLGNLQLTEGATPNLWRDMKVYADHTFIVADNAGEHGIQVFDLTRLRDVTNPPVEFDEDAHYAEFHSAHNIVINEESGFAYVVGGSGGGQTCGGALHMVDIRDPLNPTFAGCYADPDTGNAGSGGYTHDAQCVTYRGPDADYAGREVCFNASAAKLGIGDVTDKDNPRPIANASHPNVAFSHQGWLSEDQRYFYLNDELDEIQGLATGTRTLVWDVQDLDEPVLVREFVQDNPATDHNLYVRGDFMYQSNYVSGLRIFDISDPENPVPAGFFDTVPGSPDQPGFAGSFSNYPFFPSGNIIVSSMREGMFVLRKRETALVP
ncbi:choice-of-anchor B family protein [Candidatus Palauibacter sp.]|uniref:choice-of-anchor B family protein n=1 Tax=Candidatus Palauibacter sp. TaxID=3101350 RepID=UPI003B01F4BF